MFAHGHTAGEVQAWVQTLIFVTSEACSRAVLRCTHTSHTRVEGPQGSQIVLAVARSREELACHRNNFYRIFL